tara:strand:+ start:257 stop:442 length:186 start_codon:yes stop_codon:yes gene_type:complete
VGERPYKLSPHSGGVWFLVYVVEAYAYLSLSVTAEEAREARPPKDAAPDTSAASAFFGGIY